MQQFHPLMIGLLAGALALASGCSDDKTPASNTAQQAPASQAAETPAAPAPMSGTAAEDAKPFMEITRERTLVALVSAINHETREVSLTNDAGETFALTVSEEVRNLDQVAVGDRVSMHAIEDLTIEVVDGEGIAAGEALATSAERAAEGEMPGLIASATLASVYKVEAIDLDAGTYTLSDAEGNQQTFTARNPTYLEQSEVGDVVVVTRTNTVVAKVDKVPAE